MSVSAALPCRFTFGPRRTVIPTRRRRNAPGKANTTIPRCAQQREEDISFKDPVTRFLDGILTRQKPLPPPVLPQFSGEKLPGLTQEEMKEKLLEGLCTAKWFITGQVDYRLFSPIFTFKDPSVELTGIESYAAGVSRLFSEESEMDIVSIQITGDREIEVVWRLAATLNLPFKPTCKAYYVTTYFRTDDSGLICEQEDFFSIPEWELILSIFFPNIGTPPAPPVESRER